MLGGLSAVSEETTDGPLAATGQSKVHVTGN